MRPENDDPGEPHERKLPVEATVPVEVVVTELTCYLDHCSLKWCRFIVGSGGSEPSLTACRVNDLACQVLDVT
jgi:hypothetical protein